jgi:hypothetical protein
MSADDILLRREWLLRSATGGSLALFLATETGCGSLLHRERVNQPHSNDLDWKIVALDGLGLLLFFIPGVIAFAVDFYTGAIYMPYESPSSTPQPGYPPPEYPGPAFPSAATPGPDYGSAAPPAPPQGGLSLRRVPTTEGPLTPGRIESIVSREAGRPVSLDAPDARVSELASLDDFSVQRRRHDTDRGFGSGVRDFLARLRAT